MKKTFKHLTIMLACFFFISLLAGTSVVSYADEKYKDLQIFAKVLNLIQKYYVEDVDVKKLLQGGIKGMLNELDPHTNYLPPEIFKEFQEETSGEFGGIGIEISVQDEVLTIISPIEDTPAWIAGIKAGDKVVSINGTSTKGMSLVEAAAKMKGKEGEFTTSRQIGDRLKRELETNVALRVEENGEGIELRVQRRGIGAHEVAVGIRLAGGE